MYVTLGKQQGCSKRRAQGCVNSAPRPEAARIRIHTIYGTHFWSSLYRNLGLLLYRADAIWVDDQLAGHPFPGVVSAGGAIEGDLETERLIVRILRGRHLVGRNTLVVTKCL